jgi:hypothetical protein
MQAIWKLSIDEYLEIVQIGQEMGLTAGDSLEPIFLAYMKMKGQKPEGMTELNRAELLTELASHNQKILDISVDLKGQQTFKIIEPPLDKPEEV